jgi:hypothetical protein
LTTGFGAARKEVMQPETSPPPAGPGAAHVKQPRRLRARQVVALWAAAALAVLPSLPFVQSEATAFVRFHNWALFVAGLILGGVLATARAALR